MKIELESKYEVGDNVYIFERKDNSYNIIKIKFDNDKFRFVYLIEGEDSTRAWYGEGIVHKTLDKQ